MVSEPPKKIHMTTYGCQMNEYESDRTYRLFHDTYGYEWTDLPSQADLILFNTCSIREKADQKAFSAIGSLALEKRKRPSLTIAVGGCMAQMQGKEIQSRFPFVDIVFGTHQWNQLPTLVQKVQQDRERALDIDLFGWQNYSFLTNHTSQGEHPVSELVTIQNGCDKFCTFCLVPYTRGRQVSRSLQDIDKEIRMLVERGTKDVMLLGQNVNAYGRDRRGEVGFAELLKHIARIPGLERLRFITSHPGEFTTEMIDVMADYEAICEFMHLPLQSGSDEVLRRMNRNYTVADFRRQVEYLRKKIPNVALTTDIIVAFPGETRDQFQETLKALQEFQFDDSYSFFYSPRPNTKAALWKDDFIPLEEAKKRLDEFQTLQRTIAKTRRETLVGTIQEVLVEGSSAKQDGKISGKTRTNWTVNFEGSASLKGSLVPVRLTKLIGNTFQGESIGHYLPVAAA